MSNLKRWALAPVLVVSLAACGGEADKAEGGDGAAQTASSRTLAETINAEGDLETLESVVKSAGLTDVLEGKGPYTVFAPAHAALGGVGADLSGESMRAQSAALLRAHIVPGALTRADILAALERGDGGGVQMRTMADELLTFSKDGQALVVTAEDGATARLTGAESLASNGVVQPVDGVLVKAE